MLYQIHHWHTHRTLSTDRETKNWNFIIKLLSTTNMDVMLLSCNSKSNSSELFEPKQPVFSSLSTDLVNSIIIIDRQSNSCLRKAAS